MTIYVTDIYSYQIRANNMYLTVCRQKWHVYVGEMTCEVSFAKEPYKRDYILQKRCMSFPRHERVISNDIHLLTWRDMPRIYIHTRMKWHTSLLQKIVSFIGLFCKGDLLCHFLDMNVSFLSGRGMAVFISDTSHVCVWFMTNNIYIYVSIYIHTYISCIHIRYEVVICVRICMYVYIYNTISYLSVYI